MASIRRKDVSVEGDNEDFDPSGAANQLLRLLDEVRNIAVSGYTKRTVTVSGRADELADLADELQTWSPAGGWSKEATELFDALRGE